MLDERMKGQLWVRLGFIVVPAPFIEMTVLLPHWIDFPPCEKPTDQKEMYLFLDYLFCHLGLCVCSCASNMPFDYCSLWPCSFFFFLSLFWLIRTPCEFDWSFHLQTNVVEILIKVALTLKIALGSMIILTMSIPIICKNEILSI